MSRLNGKIAAAMGARFKVALVSLLMTLVVTTGAVGWPRPQDGSATTPTVGDKALEFSLASIDGHRVTLSNELTKGPVVLVLLRGWPGYQCPFCTRQFGDLLSHAKDLSATGARVILIYPGPSDQLSGHAEEFRANRVLPANFQLLIDPDYVFTRAYGLRWESPGETSYPSTLVIDRSSIVRFALISRTHGGRAAATEVLKVLSTLDK